MGEYNKVCLKEEQNAVVNYLVSLGLQNLDYLQWELVKKRANDTTVQMLVELKP